jgi:hypothetical protein
MEGDPLLRVLRRNLTEDEQQELWTAIRDGLVATLADFEFLDPETVPKIDPAEAWAHDHRGVGFQRPNGRVVYEVTGEVQRWTRGIYVRNVPLVKRSSDGFVVPMTMAELLAMEELD